MSLASHPEFVAGNVDTDFIPRHYNELFPERKVTDEQVNCDIITAFLLSEIKILFLLTKF